MENKKRPVSFDFDATLSIPSIQEYAKMLIEKGVEVWIVTSRYDEIGKYLPGTMRLLEMVPTKLEKDWNELFEVADKLGILREHIVFTNMELKYTYFKNHPEFVWHLDDSMEETKLINEETSVKGICWMGNKNWRVDCSKMLFD